MPPPTITYLMAMNHEPVVNNGEVRHYQPEAWARHLSLTPAQEGPCFCRAAHAPRHALHGCGQALHPPTPTDPLQVLEALREVGDALGLAVRPYSVTPGAAFPSFVASMAKTGVLVARHGPLLANAMFLPPGAVVSWGGGAGGLGLGHRAGAQRRGLAGSLGLHPHPELPLQPHLAPTTCRINPASFLQVLELLPYNWEWHGISEIYLNLTRSVGGLHHFAWKANSSEVRQGSVRVVLCRLAQHSPLRCAAWLPASMATRFGTPRLLPGPA